MPPKNRPETDSRRLPGGVIPDRMSIPDPLGATARAVNIDHPATTAPIEPEEPAPTVDPVVPGQSGGK